MGGSFSVLGALNAVTHKVITVTTLTYINSESVCQLLFKLAELSLQVPITLVLDNARYQRCTLVQSVANSLGIELLYLPPYSPNLNLIERLWKFVKKHCSTQSIMPTLRPSHTLLRTVWPIPKQRTNKP